MLRRAVELGVNHIDTAQYYGPDVSNELIHAALHPYPEDLVLVSKVGAARDEQGQWLPAQRPEQLRAGVEANLRSLGVEQVGVVNLRLHDAGADDESHAEDVAFESQLAEMVALRDEGKIGAVGISNVSLDQLRQALPIGIACVQNAYSVLDRSGEELLDVCRQHGVAWVPFFPLGSAFPGMAKVTEDTAVVSSGSNLRSHAGADRPGMAPRPRPAGSADPWHVQPGAPGGERRGGRGEPERGDDGRARQPGASADLSVQLGGTPAARCILCLRQRRCPDPQGRGIHSGA